MATQDAHDFEAVAILGGTGDQGLGLALRFAVAGLPVVIGSRRSERAEQAAAEVLARVPGAQVSGAGNAEAAKAAPLVILSVPFEHTASTLKGLSQVLTPGRIVVSMGVPLATAIGDGPLRTVGVYQGSCAELAASLVPEGVQVASAFQNVPAHRLQDIEHPVECDVIVSGPSPARRRVAALCALVPGLRAIDGGPLFTARIVEQWTALLIGLNIRYKVPEGTGFRITGLPDETP